MSALELGLRGVAQAEVVRVSGAAEALGELLSTYAKLMPAVVTREAWSSVPPPPDGLSAEEHAALAARKAARALTAAAEPHLVVFLTACGNALVAEADRLLVAADVIDVILRTVRAPAETSLAADVRVARERFARLSDPGADPRAGAARSALLHELAGDLRVTDAVATLRAGVGPADGRLRAAAAALEAADPAALRRRAHLLFAPLADLFDSHLDHVFTS